MSMYTLELNSGAYKFDGSPTRQPDWVPHLAPESNTNLSPAVMSAVVETWHLENFTYVSATGTPSDVTTDFSTLRTILGSAITSCVLKYAGSTLFTLDTTTCAQLTVRELRTRAKAGQWANHWSGDLVIVGRRLAPTGNVVRLDQQFEQTYDDAGLLTQTWSGRIEVTPTSSIATELAAYAPASLGGDYVMGSGGSNTFDLRIQNRPTNTVATFRQVQSESGEAMLSGSTRSTRGTRIRDTPGGRITTTTALARATANSTALAAAQRAKPASGVSMIALGQQFDALTATVEYEQRAAVQKVVKFSGVATLIGTWREVEIWGGGQSRIVKLIPGHEPFEILGPRQPIYVRETSRTRATNVSSPGDIPLPALILPETMLQNDQCREKLPFREEFGETRAADLWSREVTRVYMTTLVSAIDFDALFAALLGAPEFGGDADYPDRIATVPTIEAAKT